VVGEGVGEEVGATEGDALGACDGIMLGATEGDTLGACEGELVGGCDDKDGDSVSPKVVGAAVVGEGVGEEVGATEGDALGACDGIMLGATEGCALGAALGDSLGEAVVGGLVSDALGDTVGEEVGVWGVSKAVTWHWLHAQLPSGSNVSSEPMSIPPISMLVADTTVTVKPAWITWSACAMDVNTLYLPAVGNVTCATSCIALPRSGVGFRAGEVARRRLDHLNAM
jgi:hypothetical protein